MRIDLLTIFPEMFPPVLGAGVIGRAIERGVAETHIHDLRRFSLDPHGRVDDRPFGGGPGMVMSAQPIFDGVGMVEALDPRPATRIVMSPQGMPLTQDLVATLAARPRLLIVAGRYEGIDERAMDAIEPIEVCVGDAVVSGGEIPAMLLVDAVIRLRPGALGDEASAAEDSFAIHDDLGRPLLDCPHYTRPRRWRDRLVPQTLLDGDHAEIDRWRDEQRRTRTHARRPDLLASRT